VAWTFLSSLLDKDHFYEAIRYVELNPIRSNMVSNLTDYEFCSSRRLVNEFPLKLDSVDRYIEIGNWESYLKEDMNEELVSEIRPN
jgi:hypothetical protein